MKIDEKFIQKNLKEILENLRPDLVFEMFSKHSDCGWADYDGWNIKVEYKDELLGEFSNGKCINGKWFNEKEKEIKMSELYERLKKECKTKDFPLFLNKLLCKGKQNKGICWAEYDYLISIDKEKENETRKK